jgi:hypothetical protein
MIVHCLQCAIMIFSLTHTYMHTNTYIHRLRPKVNAYSLQSDSGYGYDIDRSLFERLVKDRGAPTSVLTTQYRMHPAISELVRGSIYKLLRDAAKTAMYDEVRGMCERLFFWDHRVYEDGVNTSVKSVNEDEVEDALDTSKSNGYEVQCALVLAKYVLCVCVVDISVWMRAYSFVCVYIYIYIYINIYIYILLTV